MSNSPTAPTSTTGSSNFSPSPTKRTAIIACGAIAQPIADVVASEQWPVDIHPLPPLLHNHPAQIAGSVEQLIVSLRDDYASIAIGYADCGTYGALDELCERYGVRRLAGLHCYDVFGGPERLASILQNQPGTYLLTDFLVRSFERSVVRELGLDRYPELRDDYFGHYQRVVWLAQNPEPDLERLAQHAADVMGLPLTVIDTGLGGLKESLSELLVK
jgi:hypothetical protein